jgi:hypothetical protein
MNKLYDMKEYNKFPKIKTTPWKSVLIYPKVVTSNQRSVTDRPNYKSAAVLADKTDDCRRSHPA